MSACSGSRWFNVAGWLWIIWGLGLIVCSVITIPQAMVDREMALAGAAFITPEDPWLFRLLFRFQSYLPIVAVVDLILGVVLIVSAIFFLRKRPWATAGIVLVCWFGLVNVVALSAFWFVFLSWAPTHQIELTADIDATFVRQRWVIVVKTVLLMASLWFLRSRPVRDALGTRRMREGEA